MLSGQTSLSHRTAINWIVACLLVFGILSYSASLQKSATFDEPLHAVSGALIRQQADYRIDCEDPILFTLFSTLDHRTDAIKIDTTSQAFIESPNQHHLHWEVVTETLYATPGNDGVRYIAQSRILFTLLGIGLGALMSFWTFRLAGPAAAMIAASIFALDPNFLAHASIIKNDVPISLLMLWLAFLIWRIGQEISLARIACLAICCWLAINVKFSGLLFGPIALTGLLIRALMPEPWNFAGRQLQSRGKRISAAIGICCFVGIVTWLGTLAIYSPDRSPDANWEQFTNDIKIRLTQAAHPGQTSIKRSELNAIPEPPTVRVLEFLHRHHLMPHSWLSGFLYTYDSTIARSTYLLGKHSLTGWWYYFPLAMLFKTPITILLLMLVAIGMSIARMKFQLKVNWNLICLWLPIMIYGTSALTSNLNLGIRHILPIYPFIYILISITFARWLNRAKPIFIIALIALSIETLSVWPDYISFFNIATGGSRSGLHLLGDSNLDWGQDLPALLDWQQKHPHTLLYVSYFGTVDPAAYGINAMDLDRSSSPVSMDRPGVFAISATRLQGIYNSHPDSETANLLNYLRHRQPIEVLGGSIYLYDWNPTDFAKFVQQQRS